MGNKVDIVVTYLNSDNAHWQSEYNYWKNYEISNGIISKNSKQAFGIERIRDWGCMKYWFRAVEKNCPWVNKIFFVVKDKHHIPDWLDLDNEKLRVVYHSEFIPDSLLPVFNSCTISLFIPKIKDLSDNYIMCDDDYFFMNKINKTRFFKNGVAQHEDNKVPFGHFFDGDEFLHIMNNCTDFEERYMTDEKVKYYFYHLPTAHKKSFNEKILEDNYDYIMNCQKPSKFRYKTNICDYSYTNIMKIQKKCFLGEKGHVYSNCGYVALKKGLDFNKYKNKDMVCFNDTDLANNGFESVKKDLNTFLKSIFPDKSSFER